MKNYEELAGIIELLMFFQGFHYLQVAGSYSMRAETLSRGPPRIVSKVTSEGHHDMDNTRLCNLAVVQEQYNTRLYINKKINTGTEKNSKDFSEQYLENT